MEDEFFNIDFQDASKMGILNLPDNPPDTATPDEDSDKNEPTKPDNGTEETEQTEKATEIKDNGEGNPNQTSKEGSPNISSSIAFTLADNGVLQTLDEERIKKVTTTEELIEAFREDIENRVNALLTEDQKRVKEALNAGAPVDKISQYEQILDSLNNVKEDTINAEGKQYEEYRKNLIFQNYINKGFDEEDAREMVERSVESGKDIDDAKKALESLKKFYQRGYEEEVNNNKKIREKQLADQKKQLEELKTSIIDDEDFYTPLDVSKNLRKKIYDTVAKPIEQPDGTKLTEIQKYMKEKPNEALKMFGTMYVLTEGFTKFEGILKGTVKKQVRESTKNLERLLTTTPVLDGSLTFQSGLGEMDNTDKIIGFDI